MLNKKILVFILLYISNISLGQTKKDELIFLTKLTLFMEASGTTKYLADQESFYKFMKLEFEIDTLKSEGFSDFVFLKINPNFKNPLKVSLEEGPILIGNCEEFIIAIRDRTVYRLKGFSYNDYYFFFKTLLLLKYEYISSSKKITENYFVEKLDLGCLYSAYKDNKATKEKYKCLTSCSEVIVIN